MKRGYIVNLAVDDREKSLDRLRPIFTLTTKYEKAVLVVLFFSFFFYSFSGFPILGTSAAKAVAPPSDLTSSPGPAEPHTAIIIHDGSEGDKQARVVEDLLGHFAIQSEVTSQDSYQKGELEQYDLAVYLNRNRATIPQAVLGDISETEKTVLWIGFGLEQMDQKRMTERYGFSYLATNVTGYFTIVEYNGREMIKPMRASGVVQIDNEELAKTYALMRGAEARPYIVNGGNFWYVADIPMDETTQYSSYLAFADVLHEVVGIPHHVDHTALIRIEDVHPAVDQLKLRAIADYLYSRNIPFSVALIPVYVNNLTGEVITLSDAPDFVETIHYMEDKGASIVLHGYTHQYTGESAIDYEFWRGEENHAPSAESAGWVKNRLKLALEECWNNDIYPIAWETPHYTASDFSQDIFAQYFPVYYGRRFQDFYPYVIQGDHWGQVVIPETMGYVLLDRDAGDDPQVPETGELIAVRDGVASAFFHPFLDVELLAQLTNQVQEDGFTYVPLDTMTGDEMPSAVELTWTEQIQARISGMKQTIEQKGPPGLSWLSLMGLMIIVYYILIFGLGRKVVPPKPRFNPDLKFIIIVPALNEELVIADTLDYLLALQGDNVYVLVVNDDSDDRTEEIVQSYLSDRCDLLNRPPAIARQGKGRALNYAFQHILSSEHYRGWDDNNTVVAILDADGRIAPNAITTISPFFDNEKTGAVQTSVRISNPQVNVLTRWQQFEFLTFNRIFQRGREQIGSVGLGGNGQFVRLSALKSLGDNPWSDCLTEDLDIGLRLMVEGWENHFSGETYVSQQAVTRLFPLIRQRSRWFQGHVTCWTHINSILKSNLKFSTRIDSIYYLLGIMLVFLFLPAATVLFTGMLILLITGAASVADLFYGGFWPYIILMYVLSFGPLPLLAVIYWKEDENVSLLGAMVWAHIFAIVYYIWFVAGCIAIWRLFRGHDAWVKTERADVSPASRSGGD